MRGPVNQDRRSRPPFRPPRSGQGGGRGGEALATAQVQVNYDSKRSWCSPQSPWPYAIAAAAIGYDHRPGRVLRPLSTITAAARRIAASSLHERLALEDQTTS